MDASTPLSVLQKAAKDHLRDHHPRYDLMNGPFGRLYEAVKSHPAQRNTVREVFADYVRSLKPAVGSFKHENFWHFYNRVKTEAPLFSVYTPEIITPFAKGLMDRGFIRSMETLRNHTLGHPEHTAAVDKAAAGYVMISRYDTTKDDKTPVLTLAFNEGADSDYSSILCHRGYRAGKLKGLARVLREGGETELKADLKSILDEALSRDESTAHQAREALRILAPVLAV